MSKSTSGNLTTTGATPSTGILVLDKNDFDTMVQLVISGTYGTVQLKFEATIDGTNYYPIQAVDLSNGSVVNGTLSPSDNATKAWRLICEGAVKARVYIVAIASGTVAVKSKSGSWVLSTTSIQQTGTVIGGAQTLTGNLTLSDVDIVLGTATGTKIGTATTQKLAFFNATPIVQPANTVDYVTMLTNLGLRATGGTAAATFPGLVSSLYPVITGVVTPTTLTASADDVAIGAVGIARFATDGNGGQNLTGMVKSTNGQKVLIMNVGTVDSITIKHDTTSTAANRFFCPNSADVTLRKNGAVWAWYDSTSSRWRVMGA